MIRNERFRDLGACAIELFGPVRRLADQDERRLADGVNQGT
jgi:hypothetical protein